MDRTAFLNALARGARVILATDEGACFFEAQGWHVLWQRRGVAHWTEDSQALCFQITLADAAEHFMDAHATNAPPVRIIVVEREQLQGGQAA